MFSRRRVRSARICAPAWTFCRQKCHQPAVDNIPMRILSIGIFFIASTTCPPHQAFSLLGALCSRESRRSLYREFCWLFVCSGVEKVEKLLTNHDHVRISEGKSSLTPCRKALIEWSVSNICVFYHHHYWGHIPTWKKVRLPPYAPSLFPKNCRGRDQ